MKVKLQKIYVAGLKTHYKILMKELHRSGALHIIKNPDFINTETKLENHFGVFDLARIEFAINFLAEYETGKSKLDAVLSGGKLVIPEREAKEKLKKFSLKSESIINECEKSEETLVRSKNELEKIIKKRKILSDFPALDSLISANFSTEKTQTFIGSLDLKKEKECFDLLAKESNLIDLKVLFRGQKRSFIRITVAKEVSKKTNNVLAKNNFEDFDFSVEFSEFFGKTVSSSLKILEDRELELVQIIEETNKRIPELAKNLDNLKILADYNSWQKIKNDLQKDIFCSSKTFAFEAWLPESKFTSLKKWIENSFVGEVAFEKCALRKEEKAPTLMKNPIWVRSFEPIVEMFGMPQKNEVDPTPFVSPFFLIFFGTCLSDVGYGLILVVVSAFFLLFGKMSSMAKDMLRLLFLSGLFAVFGGVLLGSWFGMTPELAPSFLLKTDWVNNALPFQGQVLDPMSGSGPLTFLIIAVTMGAFQLLFGLFVSFVQKMIARDFVSAICDSLGWLFFVAALLFFGVTKGVASLTHFAPLASNLALGGCVFLILTGGRDQKNWLMKPLFGLLSLFGVTGYLSDLLSYSRLMALGLATGVVGGAMNLTAGILGSMMPFLILKIIVVTMVLLAGHMLNFALSLLGAFVHSGRLQFIEFFGKFYEGGGTSFVPFLREKKYLFFRNK
jgi:V/A-type H+-transporting ATPase subunit I